LPLNGTHIDSIAREAIEWRAGTCYGSAGTLALTEEEDEHIGHGRLIWTGLLLVMTQVAKAQATTGYVLTDLGPLGFVSHGYGINASGEVTGDLSSTTPPATRRLRQIKPLARTLILLDSEPLFQNPIEFGPDHDKETAGF
jgi:hypothetical protein